MTPADPVVARCVAVTRTYPTAGASVEALVTDWRGQRWIDLPQGVRAIRKGGFIILGPDVTG